jgi:hypothetical protein
MPADVLGAVQALENLRTKCKLNKDRHFAAALRNNFYQTWIGLPVILINVFIGTVLVQYTQNDHPPLWASVIATVFAFAAASLSSVQTFFKFNKMEEGHRSVANRYLKVQAACENTLLKMGDGQMSLTRTWEAIDRLTVDYDQINVDAEAFPTTKADLMKAKKKDSLVPFRMPAEKAIAEKVPGGTREKGAGNRIEHPTANNGPDGVTGTA